MIEGVARDADAAALEDALLTVKWEVVGVFSDDEVGDEVEAGKSTYQWSCRCGSEDGRLVPIVFEANFDAFDDLANATGRHVVEELGDFLPDDFVGFGVGLVFGWKVGLLFSLKCVEAFDAAVVFSFGLFSFCVVGLLRFGCFVGGGFVLFWLFDSLQKKLQLVGVELFAAFSEEATREGIELLLEKKIFSSESFVLASQSDSSVFGCFDAVEISAVRIKIRDF